MADDDSAAKRAPGSLELVRALVNTRELFDDDGREVDTDDISTPDELAGWLAAHDLPGAGEALGQGDVDRMAELREALRAVLLANHGAELDPQAAAALDQATSAAPVVLRFDPDGGAGLRPACAGIDGAIAVIATAIHEAMREGTWERLKVCPASDCKWAFYDRSRNHSRTWCSMESCGNRAKVRAFRERQSGAA